MKKSVAVLPGDGVGPEVITESIKVLEAIGNRFGHDFQIKSGRVGGNAIDDYGTPLPQETMDTCNEADAILFGAVGGPKWDDPNSDVRPEDGILAIRKSLGLFANLRPVKVYPSLINSSPLKPEILEDVDMMVLRELTGGLYFGKPKKRWSTSRGRRGVDTLKYTEAEIVRILKVGFELAMQRRKKLTSVDKQNVLESSRLWREIAVEVGKGYPEVELDHILVDNAAMQLIRNPSDFDVIVSENTFGDILSDEASVLSGSMGMLPSASLSSLPGISGTSSKVSLYEPIHGTAPDIAGKGIANPIGSILSTAMMLRLSFGMHEEADSIEKSIDVALSEGYRTADISSDGENHISTTVMGDVISGAI
jgi:3-isopropylmalate dehydrogenase